MLFILVLDLSPVLDDKSVTLLSLVLDKVSVVQLYLFSDKKPVVLLTLTLEEVSFVWSVVRAHIVLFGVGVAALHVYIVLCIQHYVIFVMFIPFVGT